MADGFDVFLSYNREDGPAVRQLDAALQARRLRPWLDARDLRPGLPWQEAVEEIIQQVPAAAVLVGPSGMGPWQVPEMRACLEEAAERKIPVIPVLLPGAPRKPRLPLFLRGYTWVDLRSGWTDESLGRLIFGITGEKPEDSIHQPLPAIRNLPFEPLGDLFKGREEVLRLIEEDLAGAGRPAAIVQRQAIHGLGGIGKTRLAVEYAWRSAGRYTALLFVRADAPERLRAGLAALAGRGVLGLPERQGAAQEEVDGAVLEWLREHPGWLLILDNVDTEEAARAVLDLLPRLAGGHVLLTSRLDRWPATVRRRSLDVLPADEAARFLLERTAGGRQETADDEAQAARLAEALGGLPLALEQAAAYVVYLRLTFSAYLDQWERQRQKVLAWHDRLVMEYPAPVATTWQASFERLSPEAAAVLRLAAYLAPDPIPGGMFEQGEEVVAKAAGLLAEETGQQPGGAGSGERPRAGDSERRPHLARLGPPPPPRGAGDRPCRPGRGR